MIDTLKKHLKKAVKEEVLKQLGLEENKYALPTLHRPSNVDDQEAISRILKALEKIQDWLPIIFPVHPRTVRQLKEFGLDKHLKKLKNLIITQPLGYLSFLNLLANSRMVLTDSGGVQEETTILGVPCLTLRENTERPVTVTEGTNCLVGTDTELIVQKAAEIIDNRWKKGRVPELWDGKAAERIVKVLIQKISS